MSQLTNQITYANGFQIDESSRLRVSQLTRLFDGKILNQDDQFLFDVKGTGTGTFTNNTYTMSVTTGQYLVRQGKIYANYFEGNSQLCEFTWIGFHVESGVTKEIGYISASPVSPYSANLDGVRLYNDGTTIRLQSWNYGTLTSDIPMAQWSNYAAIAGYDWSKFGIGAIDFLWLGGKGYRFFLVTDNGYILAHEYHHAGNSNQLIFRSPNHPIRYSIRSSVGSGSMTYVCSTITTEGDISSTGKNGSVDSGSTAVTLSTIGITYPILGIRKKTVFRDISVKVKDLSLLINSNDQIIWSILKSPVLSAPLTYSDYSNSPLQRAKGDGIITVSSPGRTILSGDINQGVSPPSNAMQNDIYSYLGMGIDDSPEEIILCGTPITPGASVFSSLIYKEF